MAATQQEVHFLFLLEVFVIHQEIRRKTEPGSALENHHLPVRRLSLNINNVVM